MSYYYAIRKGAPNDVIVLMGANGSALDANLEVIIRGEGFDEFLELGDDDVFPVREEYVMPFIDGCVYDLGVPDVQLKTRYDEAMRRFRGKKVSNKYQGQRVRPFNLRRDVTYR